MYKKTNKHKRRTNAQISDLSGTKLKAWTNQQVKICSYCGILCEDSYQIDHIDALTVGGLHNTENLTIACPTCNRSKSNKTMVVWMAEQRIRNA